MVKVISLSEKAYGELKHLKRRGESFSDVVLRFSSKKQQPPLSKYFGKWPGPKGELEKIKKILEDDRKNFKLREVSF